MLCHSSQVACCNCYGPINVTCLPDMKSYIRNKGTLLFWSNNTSEKSSSLNFFVLSNLLFCLPLLSWSPLSLGCVVRWCFAGVSWCLVFWRSRSSEPPSMASCTRAMRYRVVSSCGGCLSVLSVLFVCDE